MSGILVEKYDEVMQMLIDHVADEEEELKCWEYVQELIEEFYGVTESEEVCNKLLGLILKS